MNYESEPLTKAALQLENQKYAEIRRYVAPSKTNKSIKYLVLRALIELDDIRPFVSTQSICASILARKFSVGKNTHLETLVKLTKEFIARAQLARQVTKVSMKTERVHSYREQREEATSRILPGTPSRRQSSIARQDRRCSPGCRNPYIWTDNFYNCWDLRAKSQSNHGNGS